MTALPTPAQTVGPFLSLGLAWPDGPHVIDPATPGAVRIGGRLFDGNGDAVGDGMIETWQAGPDGRFPPPGAAPPAGAPPSFRGFGRCLTDAGGHWEIVTLKPAPLPAPAVTLRPTLPRSRRVQAGQTRQTTRALP